MKRTWSSRGLRCGRFRRARRASIPAALIASILLVTTVTAVGATTVRRAKASGSGGGTLTICADAEISGSQAVIGGPMANGAAAAVDQVNATGGVLGHKLKLVVLNNQTQPPIALQIARECEQKYHAWAMTGLVSSETLVASIPIVNSMKIPLVAWSSGWNFAGLPKKDYHAWAFPGLGSAYNNNNLAAIKDLAVPRHYKRIAFIYENDPAAVVTLPLMKEYAKKYHFKLVAAQTIQFGQSDVTPQVLKLLAANPQMIVTAIAPGPDSVTVLKTVRAQNSSIPVAVCAACASKNFIEAVGGPSGMKDVYSSGTPLQLLSALPHTKANRGFFTQIHLYYKWMRKEGYKSADQLNLGDDGFGAIEQLVDAARAAKSLQPLAVKNALAQLHAVTVQQRWMRTPRNYASVDSPTPVVTVNGNGSEHVLKLG